MANCLNPYWLRHDKKGWIPCPCGGCLPCRKRKAAVVKRICELTQQAYYKKGLSCSFNCLTYSPANVPIGSKGLPTLCKSDYQKFFKRFRDYLKRDGYKAPFSYLGCGEYGEDHLPHYHLVLFGISDALADKYICKAWRSKDSRMLIGRIDAKPLLAGGISYVSDYVITALNGDSASQAYDDNGIERPFMSHSTGMAIDYFFHHLDELQVNNYVDNFSGKPWVLPSYYRNYYHLDYKKPIDPRPFIDRIERLAKKFGVSPERYEHMQQEICCKNAINQSREAGVPVLPQSPSPLHDSKLIRNQVSDLAERAAGYDDKIPF